MKILYTPYYMDTFDCQFAIIDTETLEIKNNATNLNSISNSISNKFDTLIDKIEDIR